MRISELFHSIQGEGQFAGTPSVFLRTTGCNLRCWFCDTAYTSWEPEGEHLTVESIFQRVTEFDCEHVVITGGEPLLQKDVVPLTVALREAGHRVTIETAGTVLRPVHADLMSISPKMANSTPPPDFSPGKSYWSKRHNLLRHNFEVILSLISKFDYQLKFVIDRVADLDDVERYLTQFPEVPGDRVWLMPQATTVEELQQKTPWLTSEAQQRGWNVSPRLHIEMFGNVRGK